MKRIRRLIAAWNEPAELDGSAIHQALLRYQINSGRPLAFKTAPIRLPRDPDHSERRP